MSLNNALDVMSGDSYTAPMGCQAVGVAIFGGTTQFIVTWLIGATGNPAAPAWYVAGTSVIKAPAMMALPESSDRAPRIELTAAPGNHR